MKQEHMHLLIREAMHIMIIFLVLLVSFRIVFYRQDFVTLAKAAVSIVYLFILPGLVVMWNFRHRCDFVERLILGFAVSAGFLGISSYYLGMLGLHSKYHGWFLPLLLIGIGIVFALWRKNGRDN
ncbi:MAG: hypothetical protein ABIF10_06930 [Candidatus Woesearchaeota archaeon]